MTAPSDATGAPSDATWELRFASLYDDGRGLAFPCDAGGHVTLDALPPRARLNYLYARTVIGREFSMPQIAPCGRCA